jgi:uncharacterized protein involved in exopolysaccharide biosynthesis
MALPDHPQHAPQTFQGPPAGYFVVVPQDAGDDGAKLSEFLSAVARDWKLVAATTLACAALAFGLSNLIRESFRAQAVVAPSQTPSRGGMQSQLGSLAQLAGVDIKSDGGRKEESYATLSSGGLTREFITRENLLPVLFADRWDAKTGAWRSDKKAPTMEDGIRRFNDDVRAVNVDHKTDLVTVTVDWYDPALAARWANGLVDLTNELLRAQAMGKAERSIRFLNDELAKTQIVELRQAIIALVETQINEAMMSNVQREYAFHVIDPARIPDRKFAPKRSVYTAIGGIAGFALALALVQARMRRRAASGRAGR